MFNKQCFIDVWFSVTIVLHYSYDERSISIGAVFTLALNWPVTCSHCVLKPTFELNLFAFDKSIPSAFVVLSVLIIL